MRAVKWRRFGPAVVVQCPKCEKWYSLDHDVDSDGRVTPSLNCPTTGCDFHEFVRLDGWGKGDER